MPVPKSNRGGPVTSATFENPFESSFVRLGVAGLNINDAIDAVEPNELTRMLNVTHRMDASVTGRRGQTALTSAIGTNHHSIRRLNNPLDDDFTRFFGIDDSLYFGAASPTFVGSGYSGQPLTFVPYHPPLSQDAWMFVADSDQMQKVRSDGLTLPIGLPPATTAATTALASENRTVIAALDSSDGTGAASWTGNKGTTYADPPVPITGTELLQITDDEGAPAVHFGALQTTPTLAGYYAYYGVPHTVDMSKVGVQDATDDDYIHLRLDFSHTQYIKEFRVYLVCSSTFSPSVLPGASASAGANSDAYVKAFSANDFAAFVQAQLTQYDASELARIRSLRDDNLVQSTPQTSRARIQQMRGHPAINTTIANEDVSRTITETSNAASDQWQNFGIVGIPLRRGDWQRIGTTAGRDWSNITGIITYIQTGPSGKNPTGTVAVRISQFYMTGGSGPDTGEPEDSPYDYRYTHYDIRTGAEGNPSNIQATTNYIDSLRRSINVTPTAYGDGSIRQRIYRRGGTLPSDWFFVGVNGSDGGVFLDSIGDLEAATSSTVETDNDQPVSTVNEGGTTVLNQPLYALWGPLQDLLFGCGNPYSPGSVYFCKPGEPDSWPPDNVTEVSSPSEALMCGCLYGGQSFAFSQERCFILYPNFSDGVSVTSTITQCTRGPLSPWSLTVGIDGIYFVNQDGIYKTVGGPEEWLSAKIDPLFTGKTANGMLPIDFNEVAAIRLAIHENELYFNYIDTDGDVNCLIYSIPYKFWRRYRFAHETSVFYSDEGNKESILLMGAITAGKSYEYSGFTDDGTAISSSFRTASIDFGRPRLEKRFGDQYFDVNTQGIDLTVVNYMNFDTLANASQAVTTSTARARVILDAFGTMPQRAANIATDISWDTSNDPPIVYQIGTTMILEPDVTLNRMTQWDDLGNTDPFYVMGVTLDCDTGGEDRTVVIDYEFGGLYLIADTLTVNADGRHKLPFSWAGVRAHKVRIRPTGADCEQWQLFKGDWNFQSEPPNIARWDTYFENAWDQYYTGLDLFCDTGGADKTVEIYVDGVLIQTETVNTAGRLVHHITLPWGRGHVFRFVAIDNNPGTLFDFRWQLQAEPSEQTNWNQNFTIQSAMNDKYLKGVIFECDTFGETKAVTVECDGVVVETVDVLADGRKVVNTTFPQHLGRVFRVYPTDDFPSRLYGVQFLFDQEPFALSRWETQEITHGFNGWSYATYGHITLKSTATVVLSITSYNQSGVSTTKTYNIGSTGGVKIKNYVQFEAMKGILHKYLLTSDEPFTNYQEETTIYVREWGTDATATLHPFGDSDQDPTRNMFNAALAAARPRGTAN